MESELTDSPLAEEKTALYNGKNFLLNDSSIFYIGLFGMIFCLVPAVIIGLNIDQNESRSSE